MPARSPVKNRNQIRKSREALKALSVPERDGLVYDGIGPGDSYVGIWRMINNYRHRVRTIQGLLAADAEKPRDGQMSPSQRLDMEKTSAITPRRSRNSMAGCLAARSQSRDHASTGNPGGPVLTSDYWLLGAGGVTTPDRARASRPLSVRI
jgi:hypothetical protein